MNESITSLSRLVSMDEFATWFDLASRYKVYTRGTTQVVTRTGAQAKARITVVVTRTGEVCKVSPVVLEKTIHCSWAVPQQQMLYILSAHITHSDALHASPKSIDTSFATFGRRINRILKANLWML